MPGYNNLVKITKDIFKRELAWVWIFGFVLSLVAVVLSAKGKLSLGKGDFVFLSLVTLLVALYRPRWIFFLFVGSISLENIILTGSFLPVQLRPYQFLGGILILALAILFASKRLRFKLLKPTWIDWLVFSLIPFSFLALAGASSKAISLKNNLVLISFVALYYLARSFLRSREDFAKTAAFFTVSFLTTTLFGFWQVFADKFGLKSFEVMFGRPNSTFTEPDWLGIYLCFALAVFLALIFYSLRTKKKIFFSKKYTALFLDIFVFLDVALIILTLSRSAWVGAAAVFALYFLALVPSQKYISSRKYAAGWRGFLREAAIMFSIVVVSLAAIHFGKLSKFDIFDRARSAATSEQKITIACENGSNVPQTISSADELAKFNCRHINLEEIDLYKSQGKVVTEIFRKDPNVMTRSAIYQKSWEILKIHPLTGIGFGTITQNLGTDERGAGLNESNIFLQIWAGSGILGLIVFFTALGYLFVYSLRRISPVCPMNRLFGCPVLNDNFEKAANIFTVLGIAALMIPNLFNAGLFMGIFWLGLATIISIKENIRFNPQ
ncbi:MAG: O-antigen ligase family protein [Candidatus Moranbacteria bacterium]|nr:O-antigen ligase family protein [Candidatus Moranbacteria bacterium]